MSKLAHSDDDMMLLIEARDRMERGEIKINVHPVFPPIPTTKFDFAATYDDYEGGDGYSEPASPIGHGDTEDAAIIDLVKNHPRD